MAEVKILIEGYAREIGGEEFASSTTSLILSGNKKIIVDPGCNRQLLLGSLNKEGMTASEIDFVVLTHTHLDHSLLAGVFRNARILDNSDIYSWDSKIGQHGGSVMGTNIKIIQTPGHDQFHCSIVADDIELGKVVIAGDVFWWSDTETPEKDFDGLINHPDLYVKNEGELIASRKDILKIADYIIPGHGKTFKVEKED